MESPLLHYRVCHQHRRLLREDGTCDECRGAGNPFVLAPQSYFLVRLEAPFKVWLQGTMLRATQ